MEIKLRGCKHSFGIRRHFIMANSYQNDRLKYEIAEELGLLDKVKKDGWKSLTSKESGKIGGIMTKRKKEEKHRAGD